MLSQKRHQFCQLFIADARFEFSVEAGDRILLQRMLVDFFDRPFQVFPFRPHCQQGRGFVDVLGVGHQAIDRKSVPPRYAYCPGFPPLFWFAQRSVPRHESPVHDVGDGGVKARYQCCTVSYARYAFATE